MGIVALMRFNRHMGAIVSDEETWNLRFRRKDYLDNIHSLVDADIGKELGISVAYAGTGYPSLHFEVVDKTRAKLRELWNERGAEGKPNPPFKTVEDVSRIALETMHAVIRRRIDLRLEFFYGFNSTDLVQGCFSSSGKSYEIKQDSVHDKAVKISTGDEEGRLSKAWFKSRATTFGYDSERGMTGYFLDPSKFVMCYNYEGWDEFGSGKYASGIVMAQYLNRKPLEFRRKGYHPAEGMAVLLNSAQTAAETFQETGGHIRIVIIDASKKTAPIEYREIFDERAVLANEIVFAFRKGFLAYDIAESMIERILFNGDAASKIEAELLNSVYDANAFELALRGYKLDEIPTILEPAQPAPAKRK